MKLGLIARCDNTGLGNQTYQFYKAMQPAKTMVVDISKLNGYQQHLERYPNALVSSGFPNNDLVDSFLTGLDVVFIAEAPYNFYLYERAKQLGVKTAVQYNYEFFDWFAYPEYPKPDMLIAPSLWHFDEVDDWCKQNGIKHMHLPCPVNRDDLEFRVINKATRFLHVAGKPAAYDRNGTESVMKAATMLKTDASITIHFQGEQGLMHQTTHTTQYYLDRALDYGVKNIAFNMSEYENYSDIYKNADVLILPRRYGGNCLPMNEALSAGMPVIMTDIEPNNLFLPKQWLIPSKVIGLFKPRTVIDIYRANAKAIAAKIDEMYNMAETDMLDQNALADRLAQSISWEELKPKYTEALEGLCL